MCIQRSLRFASLASSAPKQSRDVNGGKIPGSYSPNSNFEFRHPPPRGGPQARPPVPPGEFGVPFGEAPFLIMEAPCLIMEALFLIMEATFLILEALGGLVRVTWRKSASDPPLATPAVGQGGSK